MVTRSWLHHLSLFVCLFSLRVAFHSGPSSEHQLFSSFLLSSEVSHCVGVLKFHLLSIFCVLQTEENTERKLRSWILRDGRELFKKQALNMPGCIQA